MKTLVLGIAASVLLLFAPRSAQAQSRCGDSQQIPVSCPEGCGMINLYQCLPDEGNTFMAEGRANCGHGQYCGYVTFFIPSGYCYGLPSATREAASASVGEVVYINAYLRDCKGRYVAVQIAIDQQPT